MHCTIRICMCIYIYISYCTSTVLYGVESVESIKMTSIYGGNCGFQVFLQIMVKRAESLQKISYMSHVLRFSANVSLTLSRAESQNGRFGCRFPRPSRAGI